MQRKDGKPSSAREGSPEKRGEGLSGEPREIYFEYYPVGDSMKVSAVDSETGLEVSIVGPAQRPRSELEQVAINKLRYVMERQSDKPRKQKQPDDQKNNGKGWVV